jgi:PAS domain S-box-containing protein
VGWLAPAPALVEEEVRAQLGRRYAAVRLWVAVAALPVAVATSAITGDSVGYRSVGIIVVLLAHALVHPRLRFRVEWALAVDTTVVGMISVVMRLSITAGMGTAFLAVTVITLARGRARGWLLGYAAAWLLIALAVAMTGEGPGYSSAEVHLLSTFTILFFLVSITAMVTVVMRELNRRDRVRSEAVHLVRESEERYRTLVQGAFDAVVVVDTHGRTRYASGSYERVTGFSREDGLEKSMEDSIHPEDIIAARQVWQQARQYPGEVFRARLRAGRGDGGWHTLEVALTNLLDNPAIEGLVCNLRDVTEQVQAEDALRASEQRSRSAFESAPIGMALLGLDGAILQVNPAVSDLLGYSEEALHSMNWKEVEAPQEVDTAEVIAGLLAGGTASTQMERRQVRADGSVRECTVNLSVVRDAGERPHHLIMQLVDITDLKQAQRELEQALRGKDEFVASVSHELRTPLTAVVGFGDLLRIRPSRLSAQERQDAIEVVTAQAAEVARIVEDLLVVARSDSGQMRVTSVPVDLRAEALRVLGEWGPGEVADVVLEGEAERVQGDPLRVRQIVRNLVMNALRHGGRHVRVATRRVGASACVLVADDGPGILKEERERVFEPYQQAHRVPGVTASIGMGLTVSRRLARIMGGDVTYRFEDGESVFELALPGVGVAQQGEAPREAAAAGAPALGARAARRGPSLTSGTASRANASGRSLARVPGPGPTLDSSSPSLPPGAPTPRFRRSPPPSPGTRRRPSSPRPEPPGPGGSTPPAPG